MRTNWVIFCKQEKNTLLSSLELIKKELSHWFFIWLPKTKESSSTLKKQRYLNYQGLIQAQNSIFEVPARSHWKSRKGIFIKSKKICMFEWSSQRQMIQNNDMGLTLSNTVELNKRLRRGFIEVLKKTRSRQKRAGSWH